MDVQLIDDAIINAKRPALTVKERMRKSLKKRHDQGWKSFSVMLPPDKVEKFEVLAQETGLKKKELIELFIDAQYNALHAA